jgi:hypothetical protein
MKLRKTGGAEKGPAAEMALDNVPRLQRDAKHAAFGN